MECPYYGRFWYETQRTKAERAIDHSMTGGRTWESWNAPGPRYPRVEKFEAKQPPIHSRRRCKCGHPDAWACWSRTRRLELYGMGRT